MAGQGARLGIYGFGAAAHIIAQVALHQGRDVFAFAAPGDHQALKFASDIGATWAGFSNEPPPRPLDSAIIFAPVGRLVPEALSRVAPGGVVVCAGIHMSDIPSFPYRLLWEERTIRSVANLTRQDAREFLTLAADIPLSTHVQAVRADGGQSRAVRLAFRASLRSRCSRSVATVCGRSKRICNDFGACSTPLVGGLSVGDGPQSAAGRKRQGKQQECRTPKGVSRRSATAKLAGECLPIRRQVSRVNEGAKYALAAPRLDAE